MGIQAREPSDTDRKIVMGPTELSRRLIQVPADFYFWMQLFLVS